METSRKYGWTVRGIIALIFLSISAVFLLLGLLLWYFDVMGDRRESLIFLASFGGTGVILLTVGLICLFLELYRRSGLRRAYESGNYVMAKITGLQTISSVHLNGRHPYVLECHYVDPHSGVAHVYFSRYLYTDVRDLLTSDEVPVYIDRMNEDIAFVDVDAVLPEIRIHK
ncbi:MAG: hypothetical protein IJ242_06210 [Clostridia bacterium]|nr:hypothetical protein [Clostridia bacterium]